MVLAALEAVVFGAVDVPATQQVARHRGARPDLEHAVFHAVLGFDGVGVLDVGRVRHQLEFSDPVPLDVLCRQLVLVDRAGQHLGVGQARQDEVPELAAAAVESAHVPALAVVGEREGDDLPGGQPTRQRAVGDLDSGVAMDRSRQDGQHLQVELTRQSRSFLRDDAFPADRLAVAVTLGQPGQDTLGGKVEQRPEPVGAA